MWAAVELVLATLIIVVGLLGYIPLSSTPFLLVVAAVFLWWRGPGWRAIGLRHPSNVRLALALGIAVGLGYQFLGLYLIEPLIARVTSGGLPDVSAFRPLVGNEAQLAFWLAMSWTLAAFMEELVYRGWITNRLAELWRFSTNGWIAGCAGVVGALRRRASLSGCVGDNSQRVERACLRVCIPRDGP